MKTKTVMLNFISDALPQCVIFLLGIFKSKIFIDYLGANDLGLYQLYGQIIAYLVLIEGGVGSALLYKLYKPIADKDNKKVSSIMNAGRTIFNIVGVLILVVGIIISFNLNLFVVDPSFDYGFIQVIFIVYLVSQTMFYLTVPQRVMFEADQKRYIPNIIFQSIAILKSVVEIIIVYFGNGLLEIVISLVICSLLGNLLIDVIYRRMYKNLDKKEKKDYSMVKDVKDLSVNTVGNLLTNNIDIIIISRFISLPSVVIYSTYNYFVEAIKQFVDKITGATMASIGNLMVTDKTKSMEIFNEFNQFVFYLASLLSLWLFVCINQFILLWYEEVIPVSIITGALFSGILSYQVIRIPLKVYIFSAGMFKVVKNFVILEIIINLGLSLVLVHYLGINGVLVATIVSLIIADFLVKPKVICNKLLDTSVIKYYKYAVPNIIFTLLIGAGLFFITNTNYNGFLEFIYMSFILCAGTFIIITGYYYLTKQFSFIDRFKIFKGR